MHFLPTKKSEKRKASLDSGVGDEDVAIERKITRPKSKKKTKKAKHNNAQEPGTIRTPEDTHIQRHRSLSLSPSRSASLHSARKDSAQESPIHSTTTTSSQPDSATPTPRRSSRIKNSMHVVADTWTKCRPYIERINGTIMPLEPQGTKAYYARDGVKM